MRVGVMWITTDQAAEMYARFCRARYGVNARQIAEEKAAELQGPAMPKASAFGRRSSDRSRCRVRTKLRPKS